MRITDLMDDYYEESIAWPEADGPTVERTKELTMQKLGAVQKKRRRVPVGALIAAACILIFSVTAGAVGYSLWDAAREDAGVEISAEIPEYQEYQAGGNTQVEMSRPEMTGGTYVDGAKVELISTLCAGEDVTAYVAISPVSQEMADQSWEEVQKLDVFTVWEAVVDREIMENQEGHSAGAHQVEYDPETETALLRLEFHGRDFAQAEGFTVGLDWYYQKADDYEIRSYGAVHIPVTPSEELVFTTDTVFENDYLEGELAQITEIRLGASCLSVTYETKTLEEICAEYGENAYFIIGDAYEGYFAEQSGKPRPTAYTAMDAEVYYGRSWSASLDRQMESVSLTLLDSTTVSLADMQETAGDQAERQRTVQFRLSQPIAIEQVESITLGGKTYSVE